MSECPVCGRQVDTLRARAVGVKSGKVVAYCSAECQRKAENLPAVVEDKDLGVKVSVRTPAKGVPVAIPSGLSGPNALESGPVIEVVKEKSAPVKPATPPKGVPATAAPEVVAKVETPAKPVIPASVPPSDAMVTKPDKRNKKQSGKQKAEAKAVEAPAAEKSAPVVVAAKKPERREPSQPIQPPPDYDDDDLGPPSEEPARNNKKVLLVVAVVVIGVIVAAIAVMMSKSHAATNDPAAAPTKPAPPPEPPKPPAPKPAVVKQAALDKATAVLRGYLTNTTERVQRRAAEALSRTGDAPARDTLATLLANEKKSELARIELAYALARANDKRGIEALVLALASPHRDTRAEAANQLAMLGDVRAAPVLADYLEVSQLRLGAAEHLAVLADPRAIKALEATRADDKASADDKARAAIALVVAGKQDVAPAVRELLVRDGWSAFAAAALAGMHDAAARPVLVQNLASTHLRVDAARALRRLEPELDAVPYLAALVTDLASQPDVDQVDTAETILLLAGPASWSQYP